VSNGLTKWEVVIPFFNYDGAVVPPGTIVYALNGEPNTVGQIEIVCKIDGYIYVARPRIEYLKLHEEYKTNFKRPKGVLNDKRTSNRSNLNIK